MVDGEAVGALLVSGRGEAPRGSDAADLRLLRRSPSSWALPLSDRLLHGGSGGRGRPGAACSAPGRDDLTGLARRAAVRRPASSRR